MIRILSSIHISKGQTLEIMSSIISIILLPVSQHKVKQEWVKHIHSRSGIKPVHKPLVFSQRVILVTRKAETESNSHLVVLAGMKWLFASVRSTMTQLEGSDSISRVNDTMASKAGKHFNNLHHGGSMAAEKELNTVDWDIEAIHQEFHYSVGICYTHM
ncbi:hypothetical protein ARMGADRAFT_1026727 [Armillaria gallica]|uniref:Uncharacterized protein n=1 Tax=Armillaria gallica TaxID=47427 RepID=A0A2H3DUF4_ARMGA|nr:hypothetical protein ARMGADRAFT_1026727 [Armillaria gallica]